MNPKTFIFIGRSGCGKGTQAALLEKYLKQSSQNPVLYLETGSLFREFIKGSSYTQKISEKIYKNGGLQPSFLTVNLWASFFVEYAKDGQHWIMDGTPRKLFEAKMLDTAVDFYKREKPYILFIDVPRESASKRLIDRHRMDDDKKDIERRLDWYETEVVDTIKFYEDNKKYNFVRINGDQTVEMVHKEIIEAIEV